MLPPPVSHYCDAVRPSDTKGRPRLTLWLKVNMSTLAVSDEVDEALVAEDRPHRCTDVRLIVLCGGVIRRPAYAECRPF
jgi:hypothetical protein